VATMSAALSGTFRLGDRYTVNRLAYGSMQLTGPGVWGDPRDPDEAVRVLQRAVELGVNLIDTADSYGPFVAEQLIAKALSPYKDDLVIATKAGFTRAGPGDWRPVGRPEYLRQQTELSLGHLGLERIALQQLHRIDPKVPLADQLGEFKQLRDEGKIDLVGLSEVSVEELAAAQEIVEISSVQNLYNVANRQSEAVVEACEAQGIAFIPWFPLATGALAEAGGPLAAFVNKHGVAPSQLALAWLLHRSPVMLPIPGTSSVAHVEENIAAAGITLTPEEVDEITSLVG
jgi:pyridoxine 4-dehydrogenase